MVHFSSLSEINLAHLEVVVDIALTHFARQIIFSLILLTKRLPKGFHMITVED